MLCEIKDDKIGQQLKRNKYTQTRHTKHGSITPIKNKSEQVGEGRKSVAFFIVCLRAEQFCTHVCELKSDKSNEKILAHFIELFAICVFIVIIIAISHCVLAEEQTHFSSLAFRFIFARA